MLSPYRVLDFSDEKGYEKARRQIEAICDGVGQEFATDLDLLVQFLPSMLKSDSDRVFAVAKTIGRHTSEPAKAWEVIESCALAPEHSGKVFAFPGAFLSGLAEKDPASANGFLDVALNSSKWHAFFPHMQNCVGIDHAGCARLIAAHASLQRCESRFQGRRAPRPPHDHQAIE